jgi:hypothetical protein
MYYWRIEMKDWKESIAHVLIMQMLVVTVLIDRWASEE